MDQRKDRFSKYHPAIRAAYFFTVILTTMLMSHPFILSLSFLGAVFYRKILYTEKKRRKQVWLPFILFFFTTVLINALFNHYGVTVLFYLKTGPVTLESCVYGTVLASMLWIAMLWFSILNSTMTTDHFVFLFGRVSPMLALMLSMIFRFVPKFTSRLAIIREGHACFGEIHKKQGFLGKLSSACSELSILITWALENGIGTADSMRARGYGTAKRTSYAMYRWTKQDTLTAAILLSAYAGSLWGIQGGAFSANYNPVILLGGIQPTVQSICAYICWVIFCLFPEILYYASTTNIKFWIIWRRIFL